MPLEKFDDALRERLLGCKIFDEVIDALKDAGVVLEDCEVAAIAMAVCRG